MKCTLFTAEVLFYRKRVRWYLLVAEGMTFPQNKLCINQILILLGYTRWVIALFAPPGIEVGAFCVADYKRIKFLM